MKVYEAFYEVRCRWDVEAASLDEAYQMAKAAVDAPFLQVGRVHITIDLPNSVQATLSVAEAKGVKP